MDVMIRTADGWRHLMRLDYRPYLGQLVYTEWGERAVVCWFPGCSD